MKVTSTMTVERAIMRSSCTKEEEEEEEGGGGGKVGYQPLPCMEKNFCEIVMLRASSPRPWHSDL
jgi:hypothetical protein